MKIITCFLVLTLSSVFSAQVIPSQRTRLIEKYRAATSAYAAAQKTKNKSAILDSIAQLKAVADLIIEANNPVISKTTRYNYTPYPGDVKSDAAKKSYDLKMDSHNKELSEMNRRLSTFVPPTEITPETIRMVDKFNRDMYEAIEKHDIACQNIR